MSIEYYSKLERGSLGRRVGAIIRPQGRGSKPWSARASLQWTLDAITNAPAIVGNDWIGGDPLHDLGLAWA